MSSLEKNIIPCGKKLTTLLALAGVVLSLAATPRAETKVSRDSNERGQVQAASGSLRVGTYNIRQSSCDRGTVNEWELRKDHVAALVRKMDLDVLGLQEVKSDQADYLRARFPDYTMVGVHREDGKRRGEATPVFYRKARFEELKSGTFWLSETPEVPGSKSWGTACTRICSWVRLKDLETYPDARPGLGLPPSDHYPVSATIEL